jgi:hypothetical protein
MIPEADVDSSRARRFLFRAVPSSPRYRLRRLQRSFTIQYIPGGPGCYPNKRTGFRDRPGNEPQSYRIQTRPRV